MEGGGRSSFQSPSTGDRAAHQVHYCSAVYSSTPAKGKGIGIELTHRVTHLGAKVEMSCQPPPGGQGDLLSSMATRLGRGLWSSTAFVQPQA